MFSNLQIRPAKSHRRKSSWANRAGVTKRRVSIVPASTSSNVPALSFMEGLFGDEFPEAFASGDVHRGKSKKGILDLPAELLVVICDHLSKLDIKRFRLASRQLALDVDLRIDRVYISPNQANLNCLQRILEHPRYRHCVREIVWDDAQLEDYPTLDSFRHAVNIDGRNTMRDIESRLEEAIRGYEDDSPEYRSLEHDDFFSYDGRLTDVAKGILLGYNDQFSRDILARNATMMSVEDSYSLYQQLFHEEQDIIEQQLDISALHRALSGFPKLRRITLTSEVWRPWNLSPDYDTPFYRSLPPGFRKPSVWPWCGPRPQATPAQTANRDKVMILPRIDWLSQEWRGYGILVSALLHLPCPKVEEFIIDAGTECTGLSHQLFASPNPELDRTIRMFRRVPLKCLRLSINPYGTSRAINPYQTSGFLKQVLGELHRLEGLDLNLHFFGRRGYPSDIPECVFNSNRVLPDDLVKRLKMFALRNVNIGEGNLFDLLTTMRNVQEVTLDNVRILAGRANSLFPCLKSHYARSPGITHPKFEYIEPFIDNSSYKNKRCRYVDSEINAFLYEGGQCPFDAQNDHLKDGVGWVIDDRDKSFRLRLGKEGRQAGES